MLLGGGQNHNGFKLDLASEYGISRSQLAWIIASNNDYMIIKERTKLKRRRLGTYILPRGGQNDNELKLDFMSANLNFSKCKS